MTPDEFRSRVDQLTDRYMEDYRRMPPPGREPAVVEAYCEGFRAAVTMFATVYLRYRGAA